MDYKENQSIIKEHQELYAESFDKLKTDINKVFPNGKFSVSVYNGLGSPVLGLSFYMISDIKDQSHQIIGNDPVETKFIAHLPMTHPSKDIKFKLERLMGDLYVKPPEGSYLAMGRVKLPYRKSTGDITKQSANLVKYFKKVGQAIIDNTDNLYKKDLDKKYLDINV